MNKYWEKRRNDMTLTEGALEQAEYNSLTTRDGLAFMIGKRVVGAEGIFDGIDGGECVGILLTLQDRTGALSVIMVEEKEGIGPGMSFDEVIIGEEAQP